MRIISKEKDYYDHIMTYGQDQGVIFLRNEICIDSALLNDEICASLMPSLRTIKKNIGLKNISIDIHIAIIVFCGKTYRCVICKIHDYSPWPGFSTNIKTFYNYVELEQYLKTLNSSIENRFTWPGESIKLTLKQFLDDQETNELESYCIENKYPILTCKQNINHNDKFISDFSRYRDRRNWIIMANGNLSEFQFYKKKDPFSTYQELDMFISGILPQNSNMPISISDKDRIYQHGFDKYSFRKPKTKK
jgi:hypothetical protein